MLLSTDQILFEDNHLIVINKNAGQIVQADKTGDICLADHVKTYLKETYHKQGNVYCGVIHRLDRPVSGIVVFAKTDKALSRMNKALHDRQIEKHYWAIVQQRPPKNAGHLVDWLWKNEKQNKSYVVSDQRQGALKAELEYTLLATSDRYTLLDINLLTGRHHQIRTQLAHVGCIIKGDLKYGASRSNSDASISLHARSVNFIHPVKKEPIALIAPPPHDSLWDYFIHAVSEPNTEQTKR